jgi:hypothetical protein
VALDDLANERETEAGAVAVAVAEALEDVWRDLGGNALALVGDDQARDAVDAFGADDDADGRRGVAERVVDQVQQDTLQQRLGAAHAEARRRLPPERPALLLRHRLQRVADLVDDRVEPDRRVERGVRHRPTLQARERQQVLREAHQPLGLLERVQDHLARDGFAAAAEAHLQARTQRGERVRSSCAASAEKRRLAHRAPSSRVGTRFSTTTRRSTSTVCRLSADGRASRPRSSRPAARGRSRASRGP